MVAELDGLELTEGEWNLDTYNIQRRQPKIGGPTFTAACPVPVVIPAAESRGIQARTTKDVSGSMISTAKTISSFELIAKTISVFSSLRSARHSTF
jgi:hypothetical protein